MVVPVQASDTANQPATGDSTDQSNGTQLTNAASGQSVDNQGQPGVTGPSFLLELQYPQPGQGSDVMPTIDALKATGSSAGQAEVHLVSTGQLSDPEATASGEASSGAVNAASTNPTLDLEKLSQLNLTVKDQAGPSVQLGEGKLTQSSIKANQSKVSGSAFGLNSGTGDSTKTTKSDLDSDDRASVHVVGVDSLQALSSQTAGTHGAAVDTKAVDGNAFQSVIVAAQAGSRPAGGSHSSSASVDTAAAQGAGSEVLTAEQGPGNPQAGMSGISAARLIQSMGNSEMRVGMHSAEFGDISIRTTVAQQQMQTQISVDHSELGNALASHIPNLQAKLGADFGLHATIEVNQGGASFSNDGGRSQQQQQQAVAQRVEFVDGLATPLSDLASLAGPAAAIGSARLDIRA